LFGKLGGNHSGWGSGDLQDEFAADRFSNTLDAVDRDKKGAGATDHTILVVYVEVGDGVAAETILMDHDRQAIDGNAAVHHRLTNREHR
jgi:hypothetical protein